MRRAGLAAVLLVALAAAGCESQASEGDINRFCANKGGVLASDWHGGTVVCADKRAYDLP